MFVSIVQPCSWDAKEQQAMSVNGEDWVLRGIGLLVAALGERLNSGISSCNPTNQITWQNWKSALAAFPLQDSGDLARFLRILCLYSVTPHKTVMPLGEPLRFEVRGSFPICFDRPEQPVFSRYLKMNHIFQNLPSYSVGYQTGRPGCFDWHICVLQCLCTDWLESMVQGRLDFSPP